MSGDDAVVFGAPRKHVSGPNQQVDYYNQLAPTYDRERFGTSYGKYVDAQERRILERWLQPFRGGRILDLACGTGRFLDLATHGIDASQEMLQVARAKHPAKDLRQALANEIAPPETSGTFDAIFCFHLFMHVPLAEIRSIIEACGRCVRPGGILIFDAPSALRRRIVRFRAQGWHGATSLSSGDVDELTADKWRGIGSEGVLLFPIHRFPEAVRKWIRPVDSALGKTPLKELASYQLFCLERR